LRTDLETGVWDERHGSSRHQAFFEGLRLVVQGQVPPGS